jgi:hypothetical protein
VVTLLCLAALLLLVAALRWATKAATGLSLANARSLYNLAWKLYFLGMGVVAFTTTQLVFCDEVDGVSAMSLGELAPAVF